MRTIPSDARFIKVISTVLKDTVWYYYLSLSEDGEKVYHSYSMDCSPVNLSECIPMSEKEIENFKREWNDYQNRVKQIEDRERKLLLKIGLTQDDFCRFRDVREEDGKMIVCTRENGVNGFSNDAVQKAGSKLLMRYNDDYDSTYAYYEFEI